jgi:hypothetical protein
VSEIIAMTELQPSDGPEAVLDIAASSVHYLLRSWHYDLNASQCDALPFALSGQLLDDSTDWLNHSWPQQPLAIKRLVSGWLAPMIVEIKQRADHGVTLAELFDASALHDLALTAAPALLQLITAPLARTTRGRHSLPQTRTEQLVALAQTVLRALAAADKGLRWETAAAGPLMPEPEEMLILFDGDLADEFKVAFVLQGEACDPQLISDQLGLSPSDEHRAGQLRVNKHGDIHGVFPTGQWVLESTDFLEPTAPLEAHLTTLLDLVEVHQEWLEALIADGHITGELFCGHFMQQWNTMWELEPVTITRIARLGLRMVMDSYATAAAQLVSDD